MTFKSLFGPITKLSLSFVTFRVSHFPVFAFNLCNSQIRLTKYPKHVENDYGIFRGVTTVVCNPVLKD